GGSELRDGVDGRLVLVTGGGPIGLLVGLLAQMHGAAEIVVADPTPERRAAALALGLDAADDTADLARELKIRWRDGAADHGDASRPAASSCATATARGSGKNC